MNRNSRVSRFIKTLQELELTLSLAESMTCGLAAHMLSTCRGTSEVLNGSVVCYNECVKTRLMGISKEMINRYSAESKEVTQKLAAALKKQMPSDIYAAITGLASAGGSEGPGKPVGTVFFSVIRGNKVLNARKVFRGTPLEIREKACLHLYDLILKVAKKPRT